MHLPQVRPLRLDPAPRRHVRDGPQHHQREDLHLPVVLVHLPLRYILSGSTVAPRHNFDARQEQEVQPDCLRHLLSWQTEPVEHADGDPKVRLHRLALPQVPRQEYGRARIQRAVPRLG